MKNLVFSNNVMGKDEEIGKVLIEKFFTNLCQFDNLPQKIFFYNRGVFLCEKNSPLQQELKVLNERGVKLLVCSTCIEFYNIEILPFAIKSSMKELIGIIDKDCIII